MKKRKIHYDIIPFAIWIDGAYHTACGISPCSNVNDSILLTRNKNSVTCKNCKRTKLFKRKKMNNVDECSLNQIIGLKVVTIRAFRGDKRKKTNLKPAYILFSDEKTFIELGEQDYFVYHNCNHCARRIFVNQDKQRWADINENVDECYPVANSNL